MPVPSLVQLEAFGEGQDKVDRAILKDMAPPVEESLLRRWITGRLQASDDASQLEHYVQHYSVWRKALMDILRAASNS